MTLSELADLGEFLGGLAVLVSLVYLALQIRQNSQQILANTEAAEASALIECTRLRVEFDARIAADPDLVELWDLGHTNPSQLTDEQKRRFIWMLSQQFYACDGLHAMNRRGVLPDDTWAVIERALAGQLSNPLVRSYVQSGVTPLDPQFHQLIQSLIERPPPDAWRYTPLADLDARGQPERGAAQQGVEPDVE